MSSSLNIRIDDLTGSKIQQFVMEHLEDMAKNSPQESCHALSLEELRKPEVTFWSVWNDYDNDELLGCGALKELNHLQGEIKSMRVALAHRREGVASMLLSYILQEAKRRNYRSLSLETGSMDTFAPAQKLYAKFGFRKCGPFGDYAEDPNNLFMTREL